MNLTYTTYQVEFECGLMELDQKTPQGDWIALSMVRPFFLSRADLFQKKVVVVVLNEMKSVIATGTAAVVPMTVGDKSFEALFFFDARVDVPYRNRGILKQMKRFACEHMKVEKTFSTSKEQNVISLRSMRTTGHGYTRRFSYLSIPAHREFEIPSTDKILAKGYASSFLESYQGHNLFNTYQSYMLKIDRLPFPLKLLSKMTTTIPKEGSLIKTATLCDVLPKAVVRPHTKFDFYNLVCEEGSENYKQLKKIAKHITPYILATNFEIPRGESIQLDVRIL